MIAMGRNISKEMWRTDRERLSAYFPTIYDIQLCTDLTDGIWTPIWEAVWDQVKRHLMEQVSEFKKGERLL